jgi:hypothetical protein
MVLGLLPKQKCLVGGGETPLLIKEKSDLKMRGVGFPKKL